MPEPRPFNTDYNTPAVTPVNVRLPRLLYKDIQGRVGVVVNMDMYPDNGVMFNATIAFENEDGSIVQEQWRSIAMKSNGRFFVSDYMQEV